MPLNLDDIDTFDDVAETVEESTDEAEDLDNDEQKEQPNPQQEEEFEEPESDDEGEFLSDEDLEEAFYSDAEEDEETEDSVEEEEEDEETSNEEGEQEKTDEDEEAEDVSFVEEFGSQLGLEEDELQSHEDTWDDALEVARKGANKLAQQEMNNFFEKYPDVAEYTKYRVNGGDPDTFREEVLNAPSYDDLELEGNESTQERLVREKLQEVDGFSDEKIDEKVEMYKSGGFLKSEAEDAKDILSNKQEEKREELVKEQEKKAEQRRQKQLEEQKKYKQTIRQSDNLGGLQLPENQKDDFESYLFEPVDEEGMTQAEKDYQSMDREEALSLYYLMFQGGPENLGELVDNKASTKKARSLSEQLKKTSSRDVKDKSEKGSGGRSSSDDISSLETFQLDEQIG